MLCIQVNKKLREYISSTYKTLIAPKVVNKAYAYNWKAYKITGLDSPVAVPSTISAYTVRQHGDGLLSLNLGNTDTTFSWTVILALSNLILVAKKYIQYTKY